MAKGGSSIKPGNTPASMTASMATSFRPLKGKKKFVANSNVGKFNKGKTLRGQSKSNNKFKNLFKKRSQNRRTNSIHIEDFATKAQREAEIVKDTSKGIFDIISYRYQSRAWREFSEQIKAELQPAQK